MNKTLSLILLFLFFVLLQVLVLNNVLLFGYINPYLYIAYLFIFPLNEKRIPVLSIGFLLGLCIDFFSILEVFMLLQLYLLPTFVFF